MLRCSRSARPHVAALARLQRPAIVRGTANRLAASSPGSAGVSRRALTTTLRPSKPRSDATAGLPIGAPVGLQAHAQLWSAGLSAGRSPLGSLFAASSSAGRLTCLSSSAAAAASPAGVVRVPQRSLSFWQSSSPFGRQQLQFRPTSFNFGVLLAGGLMVLVFVGALWLLKSVLFGLLVLGLMAWLGFRFLRLLARLGLWSGGAGAGSRGAGSAGSAGGGGGGGWPRGPSPFPGFGGIGGWDRNAVRAFFDPPARGQPSAFDVAIEGFFSNLLGQVVPAFAQLQSQLHVRAGAAHSAAVASLLASSEALAVLGAASPSQVTAMPPQAMVRCLIAARRHAVCFYLQHMSPESWHSSDRSRAATETYSLEFAVRGPRGSGVVTARVRDPALVLWARSAVESGFAGFANFSPGRGPRAASPPPAEGEVQFDRLRLRVGQSTVDLPVTGGVAGSSTTAPSGAGGKRPGKQASSTVVEGAGHTVSVDKQQ